MRFLNLTVIAILMVALTAGSALAEGLVFRGDDQRIMIESSNQATYVELLPDGSIDLNGEVLTDTRLTTAESAIATNASNISTNAGDISTNAGAISTINTVSLPAKADKVSGATNGNIASLDANGNLVDSTIAGADVFLRDGTVTATGAFAMGSNKITGLANGVDPGDAVNKSQLDAAISGLSWRDPVDEVEVDSTALNGPVVAGYRVLIMGTGTNDFAGQDQKIAVRNSTNDGWDFTTAGSSWALFDKETDNGYTFDGSAWVQFSGAGQINAGDGLSKSGNTLSVNVDNSTLEIATDILQVKALGIDNSHISASAGIVYTKLAFSNNIVAADLATDSVGSDEIATDAVGAAEIATSAVATAEILNGTIIDEDISASAAIVYSKLSFSNNIVAADLATDSVGSDEIATDAVGAAEIATSAVATAEILNGTIINEDVSASAGIVYSKLAFSDNIVAGDIATGAVESTEILDGTILNADVNASAAIDESKLNLNVGTSTLDTTKLTIGGDSDTANITVGTGDAFDFILQSGGAAYLTLDNSAAAVLISKDLQIASGQKITMDSGYLNIFAGNKGTISESAATSFVSFDVAALKRFQVVVDVTAGPGGGASVAAGRYTVLVFRDSTNNVAVGNVQQIFSDSTEANATIEEMQNFAVSATLVDADTVALQVFAVVAGTGGGTTYNIEYKVEFLGDAPSVITAL